MEVTGLMMLMGSLAVALGVVCYVIATDRRRFLEGYTLAQWREPYYLRALSNFLQAMHDHAYSSPWPRRVNRVSAGIFRLRARRLLKRRPATMRGMFLRQHVTLFAIIEKIRPLMDDYILNQQQRLANERLAEMKDSVERDHLIAFIDRSREARAVFYQQMSAAERAVVAECVERRMISTLQTLHAIFQEHGYNMWPEYTQLRRWRALSGAELVHELPLLGETRSAGRRGAAREAA